MSQDQSTSGEAFMDAVVKKFDQQEKSIKDQERRIEDIGAAVNKFPDPTAELRHVKACLTDLKSTVVGLQFPTEKVQELSREVTRLRDRLGQPTQTRVEHHHKIPKLLWITAALFLLLCLMCSGWYMTAGHLDDYRVDNIKYRYLLLTADPGTEKKLYIIDSLFRSGYAMSDSVLQWESDQRRALELREQLQQKIGEGTALRGQLEDLDKRDSARKSKR